MQQAHKVQQDQRVLQVQQVLMVHKVQQDQQVLQARQVHKVQQVQQAQQVQQVLMAHKVQQAQRVLHCLLYTSPSPRDRTRSRMPSSA